MRIINLSLLLAVLAPISRAGPSTSAPNSPDDHYTYVIVHGATAGAWEWKRVGEFLSWDGHTVYRVTLTGLGERRHLANPDIGLETHILDVVNTILFEDLHDVVLTGHSYGGMVITGVMDRIPERIRHVIFLDAFVPEDGESLSDITGPAPPNSIIVDGMWTFPGYKPSDAYPQNTPQSVKTLTEPVSFDNPDAFSLPVTYVAFLQSGQVAGRDGLSALGWERAKARGWTLRVFPGHHVAQMVNPEGLAALMEEAVGDVNGLAGQEN